MILNKKALGLAVGIVCGLYVFCMALMAAYLNWGVGMVMIMQDIYLGYGASILGGIAGAIWGFIDGFIFGFVVAWLYNRLSKNSNPSVPQI